MSWFLICLVAGLLIGRMIWEQHRFNRLRKQLKEEQREVIKMMDDHFKN